MVNKVLKLIAEYRLINPGETIVVAVSGGADSVALLDVLASLKELRLRLVIAHLNHRLRGKESDDDEAFVLSLADQYGLPIQVKGVDVKAVSRKLKLSLEEGGRVSRYNFFDEVAAMYGAKVIALAHHADDQAETVLMRLLRGSAASGLCGILPKSTDGRCIRPLLGVTREEIEGYLADRKLSYRIDSTNSDMEFLRNRIRHELIPYLAGYNPAVAERLRVTAEALAADEALLETQTDSMFARHASLHKNKVTIGVAGVRNELRGARLRLYRRAILLVKGDLRRIGYTHLRDVDGLVNAAKPHMTLVLPSGVLVAKSYDQMNFTRSEEEAPFIPYEVLVKGPGEYQLPCGGRLAVSDASIPGRWKDVPATKAFFDNYAAPFPWLIRNFRAGDRFLPLGMAEYKKVKNLFIDEKIPREMRRRIPLLFSGEKLIWVCGIRMAGEAPVTDLTKAAIAAEFHGLKP